MKGSWRLWPLVAALCSCRPELPVLLYHAVGCGTDDPLDVPLEEFRAQLAAASAAGFTFVPLPALLEGGPKLPAKAVGLSFDDGAACIYHQAFPELQRRAIPFTLFIPAAWLESSHQQRVNVRTSWPTLTGEQLQTMVASGLVTVGAHGLTHARLPTLSTSEAAGEIAGARQRLGLFAPRPTLFAYPFGAFGGREVELVRAAGYQAAFAVSAGFGGRYAFHRRSIHAGSAPADFLAKLRTGWTWIGLSNE